MEISAVGLNSCGPRRHSSPKSHSKDSQDRAKGTLSQPVCYVDQMSRNLSVTEQRP